MRKLPAVILSALFFCAAQFQASQQTDIREIVKAYIEAHNSHDIETAMSFLADNIRYEEEGFDVREGTAAMRDKEFWDKAVNSAFEVRRMQAKGDTVTGVGVEYSDYFRAAGLDQYEYDVVSYQVTGGKIVEIKLTTSIKSSTEFANALNDFVVWVTNPNSGADVGRLKTNGSWTFTANTAAAWVELLSAWREQKN